MKKIIVALSMVCFLSGCSGFLPQSGPMTNQVYSSAVEVKSGNIEPLITVVELNFKNVSLLESNLKFSVSEFKTDKYFPCFGIGDVVEVIIQEQYPPVLLPVAEKSTAYVLPAQIITEDGTIVIPYVGKVVAKGKTVNQLSEEIKNAFKGKANNPTVIVRQLNADSSFVTVFGTVKESRKIQLGYNTTTILDVLAQAGGVVSPVEKTVVQIDRTGKKISLPLDEIIKNPELNLNVAPKDIITVVYKNQSVTVLGATGKNEEIEFEAKGINLNQLLARAGGLNPNLANAKGVFVFRFEGKDTVEKLKLTKAVETQKGIPVVYNVDLSKPESFFTTKNFMVKDGDIVYVATAPSVQYQHFLNLITNTISPIFMIDRLTTNK
ncbi:polysaccharide biosynthesis/export family protein [Thermodesulfovibrio sp. 1176]|uniref:polysaccharide biosynthesis/export family protein n=1 Tax=Thermodesulfovibrio sp. 1176 TaxID=3043424 RepID=UPI002482F2EE|nr:polysaccharide biosynthesis/export family protein [Thermodesulfovibrio sp. 1176]MDI1472961.1 polysaccharide biosynthesis/export family protein [Thermodesulfovibrio sp. 1176]